MSKVDKIILRFLKDWQKWVDDGAQICNPFSRNNGLCSGFMGWSELNGIPTRDYLNATVRLKELLGGTHYPFSGQFQFVRDIRNSEMHMNPERLEWVRKTIEQLSLM